MSWTNEAFREEIRGALADRGEPDSKLISEAPVSFRVFTAREMSDGTMEDWERMRNVLAGRPDWRRWRGRKQ